MTILYVLWICRQQEFLVVPGEAEHAAALQHAPAFPQDVLLIVRPVEQAEGLRLNDDHVE